MEKMVYALLVIVCALSLCSCRSAEPIQPAASGSGDACPETTEDREAGNALARTDITGEITVTTPYNSPETARPGNVQEVESTGKKRIPYTGSACQVVCISSTAELPDYEEMQPYDDTFFESHALLLVTETESSGSVNVNIASISVDGDTGVVTLSRELRGDSGTDDMAAWLLWAVVAPEMSDCQWSVANPSAKSGLPVS